jgi:hypothetical protein
MGSNEQHVIIARLKTLASSLGHTPTLVEAEKSGLSKHYITREFGNFTKALIAAGFGPNSSYGRSGPTEAKLEKLVKQYARLCAKREQIQGFFRSTLDLDELFERAGNPESLKVSAQPDTHAKFVDQAAFRSYEKFLAYYRPHVHIIMGDFVDCEGLSHWPSDDLAPRRIVPEMLEARKLLQRLVDATPDCSTRVYLEGNHERWIANAFTEMPQLFDGLADLGIEISLKTMLDLPRFQYDLYPLNELLQIGKAHFTHGIYTGIHHAKKHLDVFKTSIYYGHLHDRQSHQQTSIDGDMEAASLGCLARKDAKFLKGRPNNWCHSHGVFEFFRDGTYTRYDVPIINGRSSFNGLVFDGNEAA